MIAVAIYVAVAFMWLVPDRALRALACRRSGRLPPHLQMETNLESWHGTTILGVKKGGKTVIAGDGQVAMGNTVMKPNAKKVRRIGERQGDRRLRRRDRRRLHLVRAAGAEARAI